MVLTAAIWIGTAVIVVSAIVIFSIFVIRSHAREAIEACDKIREKYESVEKKDVKGTLLLEMEISKEYHKNALFRANLSFIFALIFAGIGILLFFSIIIFMVLGLSSNITTTVVSVIAGTFVQVLSGINFYLYNKASDQLQTFHKSLGRLQNYMLANSICQGLDGASRAHTCSQLSLIIASSSVSANEGHVIGEIIQQRAILSTEQPLHSHNGHSTNIQAVEA